jgi:hypothetical protein
MRIATRPDDFHPRAPPPPRENGGNLLLSKPNYSVCSTIFGFLRVTRQYFVDAVSTGYLCRKYRGQQASIVSVNAAHGIFVTFFNY